MTFPKLDGVRIAMSAGILIVLIIVGGLGWAFAQQLRLAQELGEEVKQLEQAVATQEARAAYLTATLEYVQTDEYVEQWAREGPKMAKPGEVVMIPVASSGGSEPPATPTAQSEDQALAMPRDRPFWAVWWEAIFGP
ncbi:MAG: septum formation initiator family protein [Anaerolineae bacterium]|jgi:cell division protein FtsB